MFRIISSKKLKSLKAELKSKADLVSSLQVERDNYRYKAETYQATAQTLRSYNDLREKKIKQLEKEQAELQKKYEKQGQTIRHLEAVIEKLKGQ